MKPHVIALAVVLAALSPAATYAADAELHPTAFVEDDAGHPLNDAWLGMPVETESGLEVGYVVDAPVNEYGEIVELVIDTGNSDIYGLADVITVSASEAELSDTHVEIPDTVARMASL